MAGMFLGVPRHMLTRLRESGYVYTFRHQIKVIDPSVKREMEVRVLLPEFFDSSPAAGW